MAARLQAHPLRILEQVQRVLNDICRDGGAAAWLSDPPTMYRGFWQEKISTLELPAIVLEISQWVDTLTAVGEHVQRLRISVWLVVEDEQDAEAAMYRLMSDALRAVYLAERDPLLTAVAQGGVWPTEFTYHKDLSRAGLAIGELILQADYYATHTDP